MELNLFLSLTVSDQPRENNSYFRQTFFLSLQDLCQSLHLSNVMSFILSRQTTTHLMQFGIVNQVLLFCFCLICSRNFVFSTCDIDVSVYVTLLHKNAKSVHSSSTYLPLIQIYLFAKYQVVRNIEDFFPYTISRGCNIFMCK